MKAYYTIMLYCYLTNSSVTDVFMLTLIMECNAYNVSLYLIIIIIII